MTLNVNELQLQQMRTQRGFIAALDQSGGSTPGALRLYGIKDDAWSNEEEMFAIVHKMRTRVITSPSFTNQRILAAILFEGTMDREIGGKPTADYLSDVKHVVPFLKVDQGLAAEADGVQLMKPMTALAALLQKAKPKRIFGTKMRSVVKQPNRTGIKAIVRQQFEFARQILSAGFLPIIEPEVDIHCPQRSAAEEMLKIEILEQLQSLAPDDQVMLKLTIPERDSFYADLVRHPRVVRVVALSGGFTQAEAISRLRKNPGVIASFSRALLEGLTAQQSDAEFNAQLNQLIQCIFDASGT